MSASLRAQEAPMQSTEITFESRGTILYAFERGAGTPLTTM